MSWLRRLFGSAATPSQPEGVVIDADIADALTIDGADIGPAVNDALHAFLEAREIARAAGIPDHMPFWLLRDPVNSDELVDDELRDRVIHRHAGETGGSRASHAEVAAG